VPRLTRRRKVDGFILRAGRLNVEGEDAFKTDPVKLVRIFEVADRLECDIHPDALTLIRRNLRLIDGKLRKSPEANASFMEILTSRKSPEIALMRMNEAGVFGRFIPDFGRVVAQMQHDMYHHYTVDEHTIRAIGYLSRIEKGEMEEEHPVATRVIRTLGSRRALYVSVLLHDIAKGRGGDHSVLGEKVARQLCPRLGLTPAETDNVAWLVLHHLHFSGYAFKRDLSDPQTIRDFVGIVKSPERLKLLLVLTVVDIRAVGPGVWNAWKRQLLAELFDLAQDQLVAGQAVLGREERAARAMNEVRESLEWSKKHFGSHARRFRDAYWVGESRETQILNARLMDETDKAAKKGGPAIGVSFSVEEEQDMTRVLVYTADQPGLFARITGALAEIGANIVDARIFTTLDGMAMDNFAVQDADARAFREPRKLGRIRDVIERALTTDHDPAAALNRKPLIQKRTDVFRVEPFVILDNTASADHTVVEVNARDRTGLLYDLARAFIANRVSVVRAYIATYGERAVDVFYVQDLDGWKIEAPKLIAALEEALLEAAGGRTKPKEKTANARAAAKRLAPGKKPAASKKPQKKASKSATGESKGKAPVKKPGKDNGRKTASTKPRAKGEPR